MTTHSITIVPATETAIPEIVALFLQQQTRQHALNLELAPAQTREQIEAALRVTSLHDALLALDADGRVRGFAQPAVWELKPTSILHAFLTARNGIVQTLTLPAPSDPDAYEVVAMLLRALNTFWKGSGTTGDLLRWPDSDGWFTEVLSTLGFQLDSVCAVRSLLPHFPVGQAISPDLQVRLARPEDEDELVLLFHKELQFHERYTPFARSSHAVLEAFRRKLRQMWKGTTIEILRAGAPVVLVVEREKSVVAMAESTLLSVSPADEPGYTPDGQYWCFDNVSVHEAFHGQGIGRVLVSAVEQLREELQLSLDGYILWFNPDNRRAAQFWTRLGFHPLWTTYQRLHS